VTPFWGWGVRRMSSMVQFERAMKVSSTLYIVIFAPSLITWSQFDIQCLLKSTRWVTLGHNLGTKGLTQVSQTLIRSGRDMGCRTQYLQPFVHSTRTWQTDGRLNRYAELQTPLHLSWSLVSKITILQPLCSLFLRETIEYYTPCLKKQAKNYFLITMSNFHQIRQLLAQRWQIV